MTRVALVTIDVEPDNVWTNTYSRGMTNLAGLPQFQALCDGHGIRPTYLVTHSVASDAKAADILALLLAGGRCEIGTHSHMWETPPLVAADSDGVAHVGSFYPPDVRRKKLATLTSVIAGRFGAPASHRAGRFGIDDAQYSALGELGYRADSSVVPGVDLSVTGAPDFRDARQSAALVLPNGSLWQVPCTVRSGALTRTAQRIPLLARVVNRIGFGPFMLRALPHTPTARLEALSSWALERFGHVNYMTHSSELWPGTSPYWPRESDVRRHYATLEALFRVWAAAGAKPWTLSEYARLLDAEQRRNPVGSEGKQGPCTASRLSTP